MAIDLKKVEERKNIIIDLVKKTNVPNIKAEVVFVCDFSMSISNLFTNGTIQDTIERILPIALTFDDDGKIPFYLFHDIVITAGEISLKNIDGLAAHVKSKYSMGGTKYAPFINQIVSDFSPKKGLFGLFKKAEPRKLPVYVLVLTDGANSDPREAEKAIIDAANVGIFFQFAGVGNNEFPFLEKLDNLTGRLIDNAGFFKIPDLKTTPDTLLYSLSLKEFPDYIVEARKKNLIL